MEQELHPNAGKNDIIEVDGVRYQRLPIKTHLITKADRMEDVVLQYAGDKMQEGISSLSPKGGGLHPEPRHPHGGHQPALHR